MSAGFNSSNERWPLPWNIDARNVPIADTGDYDGVVTIRAANGKEVTSVWNGDDEHEAVLRLIVDVMNARETTGESDPPTDGQLLDAVEQAFSNIDNGYVEQDISLRVALANLCVRFNRGAEAWWAKRRAQKTEANPFPCCGGFGQKDGSLTHRPECSTSASTDDTPSAPTSSVECPKCRTQLAFEGDECGLCKEEAP